MVVPTNLGLTPLPQFCNNPLLQHQFTYKFAILGVQYLDNLCICQGLKCNSGWQEPLRQQKKIHNVSTSCSHFLPISLYACCPLQLSPLQGSSPSSFQTLCPPVSAVGATT